MERIRVFFFRDSTSFSPQLSWDPNWLVLSVAQVKLGDLGLAQCSVDRERDLVAWQTNSWFFQFKGRKKRRTHYVWKSMEHTSWKMKVCFRSFSFSKGAIFRFHVSFRGSINKGGWEKVGWMFLGQFLVGTSWYRGM